MPVSSDQEKLGDKQYITVMVRLIVDPHGKRVRGEVVDLAAKSYGRFVGWQGLVQVVQSAVSDELQKVSTTIDDLPPR